MATLAERLQAEIDRANTTTNKTDTTVHDAVSSLIEGFGQGGLEPSEYSWNQIPEPVRQYLENVTYDSSDYTVSYIADYAPSTADVNNTLPIGVIIETTEGVLDREGYEITVSNGNTVLFNDIPNKHTEYVVRNNDVVSEVGTLKPTGTLRQIKCFQAENVRDLGGWSCDGGTVKYGMLFRGGEINQYDRDVLVKQCGVRHELNLRGKEEAKRTKSPLGDDIGYTCPENYVWMSISDKTTWKEILSCIFECATKNEPVYFHCAAGADRTGTVACVIEAILGMSQSDIDKDYELTCFSTGTSSDTQARSRNESEWQNMISSINALTVGNTFRDKVINWVATMGFTAEEINSFRNAMIDGTPDIITLEIDSFSITKSGENVSFDNEDVTVDEYQPYVVNITPDRGHLIKTVTVKMGGVDITRTAFEGVFLPNGTLRIDESGEYNVAEYEKVNVNISSEGTQHTVINTLSESTTNNALTQTSDSQSYGAIIVPNDGYGISKITVTMGGTDITSSVVTLIEEV